MLICLNKLACDNFQSLQKEPHCHCMAQKNQLQLVLMISWFFLVLLTCLLIHFQVVFTCNWMAYTIGGYLQFVVLLTFKGLCYLLYPLCGWIAEICSSKYRLIQCSFILMLISSITISIDGLLRIIYKIEEKLIVTEVLFVVSGLIALGLYEANAIQFGMDQMLEASSEQLSSFIHWYFWCIDIGSLITYYAVVVVTYFWEKCESDDDNISETSHHFFGWILVILSCIQILLSTTGIFLIFNATRFLSIQQTSRNPLKMIVKVLVFAFKHKYPIKRSAFTYWENYIPSRIDLGKEKYGGPFTYEQVEDVKTMFRLLLLMFSLFGFYLSGDGYSLSRYILNTVGCPTFVPFIIIIWNSENITNLVVVLFIPLYQFMKKYLSRYTPSLLARMWIGLFFCLLSECIQSSYSLFLQHEQGESFKCLEVLMFIDSTLELKCVFTNLKVLRNNTYEYFCSVPPINYPLIYLSLVPLILNSLSYLLVFLTTIEFICAQSPNAMKGLLIGIWYSMMSIKYIVVMNLNMDKNLLQTDNWNIYHGIRGVGIFVSIICFSYISKQYRYRERDENVNEQAIIEEQYERELLLNYSNE